MNLPLRIFLAAALAALCSSPLPAATDGELLDRSACTFPAYEQTKGIERYATKSEYGNVVTDKRFTCEKLKYSSAGLPVIAFLYRITETKDQTLPLMIFNRGSYVVNNQLPLLVVMFHRLAEAGFIVIAPMYRGSESAPGHDEMGGADLADLFNVLPLAKQLGSIDLQNVFLYGESRGGIMTLLALRDGFAARAAATFGAITDLGAYLEKDPRAKQLTKVIWPDYDEQKEQILAARSAIRWPEKIGAPLLLMHGGADAQVGPLHSLNLATRLQELGKEYSLLIFGGDDHVISQHRLERDRQAILWFKEHLK